MFASWAATSPPAVVCPATSRPAPTVSGLVSRSRRSPRRAGRRCRAPMIAASGRWIGIGSVAQVLGLVDAEQHDHEQEQHDDGAGVDDDLHGGEEVGLHRDEVHGDAEQRQHEAERGVHRVRVQHDPERPAEHHPRRDHEHDEVDHDEHHRRERPSRRRAGAVTASAPVRSERDRSGRAFGRAGDERSRHDRARPCGASRSETRRASGVFGASEAIITALRSSGARTP